MRLTAAPNQVETGCRAAGRPDAPAADESTGPLLSFDGDTRLTVKRHPSDDRRRVAKVRLADVHTPLWLSRTGGPKPGYMRHPFVFRRVKCTAIVEGRVAHACTHGPPPHRILVCLVRGANPKPLARLVMHMASMHHVVKAEMKARGERHWLGVAAHVIAAHLVPKQRPRKTLRGRGRWTPAKRGTKSWQAKRSKSSTDCPAGTTSRESVRHEPHSPPCSLAGGARSPRRQLVIRSAPQPALRRRS